VFTHIDNNYSHELNANEHSIQTDSVSVNEHLHAITLLLARLHIV